MADLDHFIPVALDLASKAQDIALTLWKQDLRVDYKSDGSSLTQADLSIETHWRNVLKHRFPDHGILGEEFGTETGQSAYTWVLDPVDGTRPFGAGLLNYASLIALCRDGKPILGVIALPISELSFVGAEGRGTYFAGRLVKTSGRTTFDDAIVSLANPESFLGRSQLLNDRLVKTGRQRVYDGGSPAYGALARGLIDVCLNGDDLDAFDICALCPIVQEAGGIISDLDGRALTLNSKGAILASASKPLHEKLLSL